MVHHSKFLSSANTDQIRKKASMCWSGIRRRSKILNLDPPIFSKTEFIDWYLKEQKLKKLTVPSISRLDHSKGYSWDNFRLEELADNSKEVIMRTKLWKRPADKRKRTAVLDIKDGSILIIYPSLKDAAKATGVKLSTAKTAIRRKAFKNKISRAFDFKYIDKEINRV